MTQYVDSEYRQVDGPNAQKWGVGVPLTAFRTLVSDDIPATKFSFITEQPYGRTSPFLPKSLITRPRLNGLYS